MQKSRDGRRHIANSRCAATNSLGEAENNRTEGANNRAEGTYQAVANLGTRPTLNGDEVQLEVHLFDFSGNLYGQHVTVTPVAKLRAEQRFASLDQLKQQIQKDAARAKQLLAQHTAES